MRKKKTYLNSAFSADVLKEAIAVVKEIAIRMNVELKLHAPHVRHDDGAIWEYDNVDEFFSDYRKYIDSWKIIPDPRAHYDTGNSYLEIAGNGISLTVIHSLRSASIEVLASVRADIEMIFDVFERHSDKSKLQDVDHLVSRNPIVFIGHGRTPVWRDLKDHLQDKHNIRIEAYETGARAGHTIRDILEEMVAKSSFAILVLTCEDEQANGSFRSRQNVIHEAGLFQGRLGFARAILLLEDGVEQFSNVDGVQYISFGRNNIKETFGDVLATIRREFPLEG